jgi:hypothetical protein
MSKPKGKQVDELSFDDAPETEEESPRVSAAEESAKNFGGGNSFAQKMQQDRLTKLDINEIYPDPLQPRRVVPTALRQRIAISPDRMNDLLSVWIGAAEINPLDYWDFDEEDLPEEEQSNPIRSSLIKLIGLASGIDRDGLVNPISVALDKKRYYIETGERRWFAFHLLHYLFPEDERWQRIPTRVMPEHSVWRQASENNSRDDLNAISKSRQYAILMMNLVDGKFLLPHEAESEQAYYAQVLGERVPRGQNANIMQAMGFNGRASVDRHRDLLRLPEDIWLDADDYNIPETVLREVLDKPYEQARAMINDWLDSKRIVSLGDNSRTVEKIPAWLKAVDKVEQRYSPERWKNLTKVQKQEVFDKLKAIVDRLAKEFE